MPGWRWMLLVLLLGGQRLETSGIAVAKGLRDHKAANLSADELHKKRGAEIC